MAPRCAARRTELRQEAQNTPISIRRFDATDDAAALRDCVVDQQNVHRGLEPSWPAGDAIVSEYIVFLGRACAEHDGCILMAHDGGQAAGFVCVLASVRGEPDDPALFAWVQDIYVKPAYRRGGVASLLMAEAEHVARERGARSLRLGVLDGNGAARRFYARQGFRQYTRILTKDLV